MNISSIDETGVFVPRFGFWNAQSSAPQKVLGSK